MRIKIRKKKGGTVGMKEGELEVTICYVLKTVHVKYMKSIPFIQVNWKIQSQSQAIT